MSAVNVRRPLGEDLEHLLAMGRRFFDMSGFERYGERFDPDSFVHTLLNLESGGKGALFVGTLDEVPQGMAAVLVYPKWFDGASLCAQELMWWVEPQARGTRMGMRLLRAMEDFGRESGAKTMVMSALARSSETLERVFHKLSYESYDRQYVRRL